MTTHLDDTQGLEQVLNDIFEQGRDYERGGELSTAEVHKDEAKQAILHWVNTEIVGEGEPHSEYCNREQPKLGWCICKEGTRNDFRQKQKDKLIHHGYKQNTKEVKE